MVCWYCSQLFPGPIGPRCKKNGMEVNTLLFNKKWQDPRCPVLDEYNRNILAALAEAAEGAEG